MTELVHYTVDRAVATITLDSPGNRNALSAQLVTELTDHVLAAAQDPGVRAIILRHVGPTFCAGADLRETTAEGGLERGTKRILALLAAMLETTKPIVACIGGAVRAGGLGLVGAADLAFAVPKATFAFSEVRLGLAPAMISLTTLGRMTERAASRYYLTGETFDAAAATECGLITGVAEDLDAEVAAIADAFRLCSPQGLSETKPLTTHRARQAFVQFADEVQAVSARLFASEEAREGMLAFLEKRSPRWAQDTGG